MLLLGTLKDVQSIKRVRGRGCKGLEEEQISQRYSQLEGDKEGRGSVCQSTETLGCVVRAGEYVTSLIS